MLQPVSRPLRVLNACGEKKKTRGSRFSKDPINFRARKAIFNNLYLKKESSVYRQQNFTWKLTSFVLKLCEKNRSVNIRFKIFVMSVMAFRALKLLGTFEKRAPGLLLIILLFTLNRSTRGQT